VHRGMTLLQLTASLLGNCCDIPEALQQDTSEDSVRCAESAGRRSGCLKEAYLADEGRACPAGWPTESKSGLGGLRCC